MSCFEVSDSWPIPRAGVAIRPYSGKLMHWPADAPRNQNGSFSDIPCFIREYTAFKNQTIHEVNSWFEIGVYMSEIYLTTVSEQIADM